MSVTVYGEIMDMDGVQWQPVVSYDLAVTPTTNTLSNITLQIRYRGTATRITGATATLRVGYTKTGASLVYMASSPNTKIIIAGATTNTNATQPSWVYGTVASADNSVTVNTASGQQLYISTDIGYSVAMTAKLYSSGTTYTDNIDTVLDHHVNDVAELTYFTKPQITSMSAVRCNAQGEDDDTGAYARISAEWSVDASAPSNTGAVTGTITPQGGSASALTISSGSSGASGTAVALASNLDSDTQYTVTITVTDLVGTTSRNVILTRAFFIMDFKAGGVGIGIGRAAPASGLEVGYKATFDDNVNLLASLLVGQWAGVIQMFGGSTPPAGWLLCDGSAVSRTEYAALYTAIGETWGAGDGSTTFNLPDLRGRAPIGAGTGSGLTARTLGDNVGTETHAHGGKTGSHTLTAAESGNQAQTITSEGMSANASHSHQICSNTDYKALAADGNVGEHAVNVSGTLSSAKYLYVSSGVDVKQLNSDNTQSKSVAHTHQVKVAAKAATHGHDHTISSNSLIQPSAVVNFIIHTGKTS